MRTRWGAVALAAFCLFVGPTVKPACFGHPPRSTRSPNIEPSLPVFLDLQLASVSETGGGGSARLEVTVNAGSTIEELSVNLRLPEGLRVQGGTPISGWTMALEAGGQRRYEVPLVTGRNGAFPIRAEMFFRLPDGRSFRAVQGTTLRLGAPLPQGRINAGAYEFRGVPLEELQR